MMIIIIIKKKYDNSTNDNYKPVIPTATTIKKE